MDSRFDRPDPPPSRLSETTRPARLVSSQAVVIGLWVTCGLLILRFVTTLPWVLSEECGEFVAYLASARVVVSGEGAAHFYDDDRFREEVLRQGFSCNLIYRPNPPTTSLLMIPLAGLDPPAARTLWALCGMALVGLSLAVILRELKPAGVALPLLVAATLYSQPIRADLRHGQVYSLVLFILVLAWFGWRHERPLACGISLAAMIATKLSGAPLWILAAVDRRWRVLAVAVATLAAVTIVSLPLVTPSAWARFLDMARAAPSDPALSVTAFQSIGGFVGHLLVATPEWNPEPIVDAPLVAWILGWLLYATLLVGSLFACRRTANRDLAFAIFAVVSVVGSPYAQDYTYTLLVLPMGVVLAQRRLTGSVTALAVAVLGIGLVSAPIRYQAPALASGVMALAAYPKVYGALLIWSLLVWLAATEGPQSEKDLDVIQRAISSASR
jgi:hypothetical protein